MEYPPMPRLLIRVLAAFGLAGLFLGSAARAEQDLVKAKWLKSTAHAVPKETATEGEGYFSIIEGHNGRLYIGTHANGLNAWLVEFDPPSATPSPPGGVPQGTGRVRGTERMRAVVDAQKEIGTRAKGFSAQAKIHTR